METKKFNKGFMECVSGDRDRSDLCFLKMLNRRLFDALKAKNILKFDSIESLLYKEDSRNFVLDTEIKEWGREWFYLKRIITLLEK